MNAQVVAVRGSQCGCAWRISERGITFGRSAESDVLIPESSVSRRHCRVFIRDSAIWCEDLGSRNPALVNGRAVRMEQLKFGDELSLGDALFVVAKVEHAALPNSEAPASTPATRSWRGDIYAISEGVSDDAPGDLHPRTTAELSFLYEAATRFSRCASLSSLFDAAQQFIQQQFSPTALWMALVHDSDSLTFLTDTRQDPPAELMQRAARERNGLLQPKMLRGTKPRRFEVFLAAAAVHADECTAVLAIHAGSDRPVYDEDDLCLLVLLSRTLAPCIRAIQHRELLEREVERLRHRAGDSSTLVGESEVLTQIRALIQNAANTDISVLITGETGTGKEVAARAIHAQSSRNNMPLIVVNCAAIPRELFESELFGHEKGAYTGADNSAPGLLMQAHGGTLFLDEIGDLSLENQARILRVAENHSFRSLGGQKEITVDIRIIAATNHDLKVAVDSGAFRKDLYHRLNGIEINMPPLRVHNDDVPELAEHFLQMFRSQAKRPLIGFAPDVVEVLQALAWPGNVRELRNSIHRAITLCNGENIKLSDIMAKVTPTARHAISESLLSLPEVEKRHIAAVWENCGANTLKAAQILGIARSTLYNKLREHGIV